MICLTIKIFHTADLHIGMKYNRYPDGIKNELVDARLDVLDRLIRMANDEECNIFAIAGDLFNGLKASRKNIDRVIESLNAFSGECVVVIPGNHDYDNGMIDLWNTFNSHITEKIIYMNEEKPYDLNEYGLEAVMYPAPCHSRHSDVNNIGWIKGEIPLEPSLYHIGIAHGALEGISPDIDKSYYYMSNSELEATAVDVWLLGHTHVTYPEMDTIKSHRIFNSGTPEPDGFDCRHEGHAWIISIDEDKEVNARQVITGKYRFIDEVFNIKEDEDLYRLKDLILQDNPERKIMRITLEGRISSEVYSNKQAIYNELRSSLAHLIVNDSNLSIKVSKDIIEKEFTNGSFPYHFLNALANDDEALQIAYELVKEVK